MSSHESQYSSVALTSVVIHYQIQTLLCLLDWFFNQFPDLWDLHHLCFQTEYSEAKNAYLCSLIFTPLFLT